MDNLISEFFFEGIRRIVPGLVIIILYFHKEATSVLNGQMFRENHISSSPYIVSLCILCVAWLVGYFVELATYVPFYLLCPAARKSKPPDLKKVREEYKWEQDVRRQSYLADAEKRLCRCLFCTFFFALFVCPENFSNFKWSRWLSLLGFSVFLLGWIYNRSIKHSDVTN